MVVIKVYWLQGLSHFLLHTIIEILVSKAMNVFYGNDMLCVTYRVQLEPYLSV